MQARTVPFKWQLLDAQSDEDELAGLEPATSWVRSRANRLPLGLLWYGSKREVDAERLKWNRIQGVRFSFSSQ
jgi:hypothetical protein